MCFWEKLKKKIVKSPHFCVCYIWLSTDFVQFSGIYFIPNFDLISWIFFFCILKCHFRMFVYEDSQIPKSYISLTFTELTISYLIDEPRKRLGERSGWQMIVIENRAEKFVTSINELLNAFPSCKKVQHKCEVRPAKCIQYSDRAT